MNKKGFDPKQLLKEAERITPLALLGDFEKRMIAGFLISNLTNLNSSNEAVYSNMVGCIKWIASDFGSRGQRDIQVKLQDALIATLQKAIPAPPRKARIIRNDWDIDNKSDAWRIGEIVEAVDDGSIRACYHITRIEAGLEISQGGVDANCLEFIEAVATD